MADVVWEEQARRGRNHAVLLIDVIAGTFKKRLVSEAFGIQFNPTAYRQFDGARHFATSELQAWLDLLREKEAVREGYLLDVYLEYEEVLNEFRSVSDEIAAKNWSEGANDELKQVFLAWVAAFELVNSYAYGYTILNRFYPDEVKSAVAAKEPGQDKQNAFLKVLLSADKFSETRAEQESLVAIALLAKERGLKDPAVKRVLGEHAGKFGHLGLYYFYKKPFVESDFSGRLEKMLEGGLEEKIRELEFQKSVPQESEKIMRLLGFSESERLKVKTIKQVAFTVNYYDETVSYAVCKCLPLFNEISRKLGVSYAQLVELTVDEITRALSQGFLPDSLKKEALERYADCALVYANGKTNVLVGNDLKEYYTQEKQGESSLYHLTEINGQSASPGKVRGTVKILSSAMELDKVKKGDILVAASTYPAFVPAMERAAAIVTNEGGLLCHAAIVSRELGVPCVVGTKIATKVLKDGDVVEVDAEKGLVRKLSG